jgi:hypothetical protein
MKLVGARRRVCAVLLFCCAGLWLTPSRAQTYALDSQPTLVKQYLFGLHHGIALLAHSCLTHDADTATRNRTALATWQAAQRTALEDIRSALSRHYAHSAQRMSDEEIIVRLRLPKVLPVTVDSPEFKAACATLGDALQQPRYDFVRRLRQEQLKAITVSAIVTEERHFLCQPLLPTEQAEIHAQRYAAWSRDNQSLRDRAMLELQTLWPSDEGGASGYISWVQDIKTSVRKQKRGRAACWSFSQALTRPDARLDALSLPPITAQPTVSP